MVSVVFIILLMCVQELIFLSMHVLSVSEWVFPWYSGFLPHPKHRCECECGWLFISICWPSADMSFFTGQFNVGALNPKTQRMSHFETMWRKQSWGKIVNF